MSVDLIKNRLKNQEQRVSIMNAATDVSWQLEEFLAAYSSKKQAKFAKPRWQNKFIKKSLKLMLRIQPLIENIDLNKVSSDVVIKMVNEISNYPLSEEINLFQIANLLAKYYIFFPYIYMDLSSIYISLKDDDQILSMTELREKVLSKYLPKILNAGPNIFKTWEFIKAEKSVLNDFDIEMSKTLEAYILNFLTPEELKKVRN